MVEINVLGRIVLKKKKKNWDSNVMKLKSYRNNMQSALSNLIRCLQNIIKVILVFVKITADK